MSDELEATVNYSEVQAVAERWLQDGAFTLIETAAQATAQRVAQTFGVDDVGGEGGEAGGIAQRPQRVCDVSVGLGNVRNPC